MESSQCRFASRPGQLDHAHQRGVTVIEYAILAALLSIAAIAVIVVVGDDVRAMFQGALELYQNAVNN